MRPALRGLAAYRDSEPAHAELALALVAELRSVDVLDVETQLHRLAGSVALNGASTPLAQLERVAETVLDSVSLPDRPSADDGDLILSEALARGCAHREPAERVVLDCGPHRGLRSAADLQADLCWHHAHQVCCAMLQALLTRSLDRGDLAWALRLAELRLELPFDADTRQGALEDLTALRAQLN